MQLAAPSGAVIMDFCGFSSRTGGGRVGERKSVVVGGGGGGRDFTSRSISEIIGEVISVCYGVCLHRDCCVLVFGCMNVSYFNMNEHEYVIFQHEHGCIMPQRGVELASEEEEEEEESETLHLKYLLG